MAVTEDLLVRLTVDADGAIKGASLLGNSFTKMGKNAKSAKSSIDKLKDSFPKAAANIIAFNQGLELAQKALRGLNVTFNATIGQFAKFETALIGVQKTTDLEGKSLADFGKQMQSLSEEIPVTTNELLDLAKTAGQLGVSGAKNLALFAETIAKVGVATDLTGEQAAISFKRILDASGEGIENIANFASVVVRLGNNFAATESEITKMANEVARATSQFKLGSTNIAAISTALKSLGQQAQLGGSVVGKTMRTLDAITRDSTGRMAKSLSRLTGIASKDLRKTFATDATKVFKLFVSGLGELGEAGGSVSDKLETFGLKGDEVNKVIPVLASRADILADALKQAGEEAANATALNEEAAKAFGTLASQMTILGNVVVNIGTDIGAVLAPAFSFIIESITTLMQSIRAITSAIRSINFSKFIDEVMKSATTIGILTAAFVTFKVVGIIAAAKAMDVQLGNALKATIVNMKSTAIATWAAIKPMARMAITAILLSAKFLLIAAAIGVIVAAIDILVRNASKLDQVADLFAGAFLVAFENIKLGLLNLVSFFLQKVSNLIGRIGTAFPKIFGGIALKAIEQLTIGLVAVEEKILKTEDASKELTDQLKETAKGLDLGPTGKIIEGISGLIDKMTGSASNANGELGKIGVSGDDAVVGMAAMAANLEKIAAAAKRIKDENAQINEQLITSGLKGVELLKAQNNLKIEALKASLEELKVAGKFPAIIAKGIAEQERLLAIRVDDMVAASQRAAAEKALNSILSENGKINSDLLKMQLEGNDLIDAQTEAQLNKLESTLGDLKAQGALTEEIKKQAKEQEKLIKLRASESKATTVGDVGGAVASAAGIVFDTENLVAAFDSGAAALMDPGQLFIDAGNILADGGLALMDAIASITLEDIADVIMGAFEMGAALLSGIFSGALVQALTDGLQDLMSLPGKLLDSFLNLAGSLNAFAGNFASSVSDIATQLPGVIDSIVEAIPSVIQSIIDSFPAMAQALVEGIIRTIPALALGFAKAFPVIIKELAGAIGPIISALIEALPLLIEGLITGIVQSIPLIVEGIIGAFSTLIKVLPDIFKSLIDQLPALFEAIATAIPDLVVAFVDGIISLFLNGGIEKIIGGILRAIPKIAVALVKGIVRGLSNAFDTIFNGFGDAAKKNIVSPFADGMKLLNKSALDGVKKITSTISKNSSQLFAVADLAEGGGGLDSPAITSKSIIEDINKAAKKAKDTLLEGLDWAKALALLLAGVKLAGLAWNAAVALGNKAWKGAVDLAGKAWDEVVDLAGGLWEDAVDFAGEAWDSVVDTASGLWEDAVDLAGEAWDTVSTAVSDAWEGAVDAAGEAWDIASTAVADAWESAVDAAGEAWDIVSTAVADAWEGAVDLAGEAWDLVASAASAAWELAVSAAGTVWELIVSTASAAWEFAVSAAGVVWNAIVVTANALWTAAQTAAGVIWNLIVVTANGLWTAASTAAGVIWNAIVVAGNLLWTGASTAAGVIWNAIVVAGGAVWTAVQAVAGLAWNLALAVGGAAWGAIVFAWSVISGLALAGPVGLVIIAVMAAIALMAALFENDTFKKGLKDLGDTFGEMGTKIWEGLKKGLEGVGKIFSKAFELLNPANLLEKLFPNSGAKSPGTVEKIIAKVIPGFDIPFVKFAEGGVVPGSPTVAGDSPLNDKILSLLSPGEIVLSRTDVAGLEKLVGEVPGFFKGFKKPAFVQKVQDEGAKADEKTGGNVATASKQASEATEKVRKEFEKFDVIKRFKDTVDGMMFPMMDKMITAGVGGVKDVKQKTKSPPIPFEPSIIDNLLNQIDLSNVMKNFPFFGMQDGGVVTGVGTGDLQPRMLEAGEFVINKNAASGLGLNVLGQMNRGGGANSQPPSQTFNIELNIENKGQDLDEGFIRNRVIPATLEAIKRASVDGRFTIAQKGIRQI